MSGPIEYAPVQPPPFLSPWQAFFVGVLLWPLLIGLGYMHRAITDPDPAPIARPLSAPPTVAPSTSAARF